MKNEKIINLFIVEDDIIYATALKQFLQTNLKNFNYNISIQEFKTGESCIGWLDCYNSIKPDIIILDYFLNSRLTHAMNGVDALSQIKIYFPEVKIILHSGQQKMEVAVQALKAGAFDYVVKNEFGFMNVLNAIVQSTKKIKSEFKINNVINSRSIAF